MKKILFITCVMGLIASSAFAHDTTKRLGLGFDVPFGLFDTPLGTPLGVRYWFSDKIGFDIGAGISVDDQGDDSFTDWAVSGGLPITLMKAGDRVNLHLLPWVQYTNVDLGDDPVTGESLSESYFDIVAALEFEVFVTNDLSVSAIQGVDFQMFSPSGDADSETDIRAFGLNLTEFGVHYYLPGGGGGE